MAKTFRHTIRHGLDLDDAQAITFNTVTKYAAEYNAMVEVEWKEACHAQLKINIPGSGHITGDITIGDTVIAMTLKDVPLSLRPFAPMAINRIDEEAKKRIAALKANRRQSL
jgi:hypothetical protein